MKMINMDAFSSVKPLFEIFRKANGEIRVVGGAVRDVLLGRSVHDIDLATTLEPGAVIALLEDNDIKVIPTGIEFGTVTAVLDHVAYQITSLRKDIETDGRHASVTYTENWKEDSGRRDFTFNALYLDEFGQVYDFRDGLKDLESKTIRFIGDPSERIKEDYLRLLRAYRFQAQLTKTAHMVPIEANSLAACVKLAHNLPQLSAERIWQEFSKLLSADAGSRVWALMTQQGVSRYVLEEATNTKRFAGYHLAGGRDPIAALSSLIKKSDIRHVSKKLKLSRKEKHALLSYQDVCDALRQDVSKTQLHKSLYKHDGEIVKEAGRILSGEGINLPDSFDDELSRWSKPNFPIRGHDLIELGFEEGADMGRVLRQIELWWIESGFKENKIDCLKKAMTYL